MSRFLLPISRNWIGEEFYGTKYALAVAAPHAVSPFLYAKCVLFACGADRNFPRAAAYFNGFLQALRSGAMDPDLVQYAEHFDRAALGRSPGLRKKDENELKIIRTLTPMQHRTMIYDAVKATVYLRGLEAPNALKQLNEARRKLLERISHATSDTLYAEVRQKIEENATHGEFFYHANGTVYVPLAKAASAVSMPHEVIQHHLETSLAIFHQQQQQQQQQQNNNDASVALSESKNTQVFSNNSVDNNKAKSNSGDDDDDDDDDEEEALRQLQREISSDEKIDDEDINTLSSDDDDVHPALQREAHLSHQRATFHQPSSGHPHHLINNNNNNCSTTAGSNNGSSSSNKAKIENIHTPNATYDSSLNCLKELFCEKQLCDLDVLGRELGLAPEVVVKACEIALQERDITLKKAKLFEGLV